MEKMALTIEEMTEAGGGSRNTLYRAIADKKLKVRKRGRSTIALAQDFAHYLESLPDYHEAAA